ncbi:MAG: hypothetical protein GY870_03620 [archaeon]|nr:hypothetical protein [archaeon]
MNQGFFTQEEVSKYRDDSYKTKKMNCFNCGLYKKCNSPKMELEGEGKKKILIIGQSPSKQMDKKGTVYTGQGTFFLKKEFKKHGIDIKKDCWKTNAVQCYNPNIDKKTGQQKITSKHVQSCRKRVFKIIKEVEPEVIILLGKSAVESVIGKFFKKDLGEITKWVNWTIPDRELKCWVCPMYHPSMIYNSKNEKSAKLAIRKNIEKIVSVVGFPLPEYKDEKECVEILTDFQEIKSMFESLDRKITAHDYECTSLKPHAEGHEIVCCSIAVCEEKVYSFMITKRTAQLLKRYLVNDKIFKIAQNMKFEHNWGRVILGVETAGWLWDTMIGQHTLDSRSSITSLKFMCYVYYGLADYDSHINWGKQGSNEMNKIHDIPVNELLLYCGMDSLLTFKLAFMQMRMFGILDPYKYAKTIN